MDWEKLTEEQKQEKLDKLQEICDELLIHHPDYINFKTAKIKFPVSDLKQDNGICAIKWNGKRLDEKSGWGMVTREFPISDIQHVIRRYLNKLQRSIKLE